MSKEMLELADELARFKSHCKCNEDQAEDGCDGTFCIGQRDAILAALRASAVAEPVAWRWRRKNDTGGFGEWHVTEGRPNGEVYDLTPLSNPAPAAPVPASVREALMLFADPSAWRLGGSCDPNSGAFRGQEIAQRALASLPAPEAAPSDIERAFQDACDEAGCAYDNEALLMAIHALKSEAAPTREETIEQSLTADFTKSLPGGALDDSTYSQIEDALDAIDAPMTNNGRYMTLVERILALKAAPHQRQGE